MINNERVHNCACKVQGLKHVFTADASDNHILIVDPVNVHLLTNTAWTVSPVHRRSKRLHARATHHAPGIRKGKLLPRSVFRLKGARRVRAINRNPLDARRANLQTCTRSDIAILNRSAPVRKIGGVHYSKPPRWNTRTECFWHTAISIRGDKVHLGSFRTPEEAAAAFDAAAIKVHGAGTSTNQKLGLLSFRVAKTKTCRKAARAARNKVNEHQVKVMVAKMEALKVAQTQEERRAIFASMVSPSVRVPSSASTVVRVTQPVT